jgi:hypothetical protein
MGSWVGWALIFVRGIGVGCLKEWQIMWLLGFGQIDNLHTKSGN